PPDGRAPASAPSGTNNTTAGRLTGKKGRASSGPRRAKTAPPARPPARVPVDAARHNGFLAGMGNKQATASAKGFAKDSRIVCSQDAQGDQAKGQTAMENCIQKSPDINLLYTINEPTALGAYTALKAAGKEKQVTIVSV